MNKTIMFLAIVFIISVPMLAATDNVARRQIAAVRVETPPEIDGRLDDPVWEKTEPSEGFIQNYPDRGKPMTERTAVMILYDHENIYVGFQFYDSQPEKIIATETRRDYEGIWGLNDCIRFVFDTYHDRRNAYYFGTNPLGAQFDARITDNGNFHLSWDAVWDCAAISHSQGWSAEFSIPFRQLRFPDQEKHVWGFNCARTVRRKNEGGCWSSIESESVLKISAAGEIVGLENIEQGHMVEIRPTFTGGTEFGYSSETDVDSVTNPSLDVKYGLTSALTLDATINTDFAQVEADEERVNLSRFDIFFEEKRPFFLEGVGLFNTPISLFYSRRIGTSEGREVPILGGLKLTGKAGKQSLGLLSVQTDEVAGTPSTNFSAFRVQRDILQSSSAGMLFVNKAPWEGGGDNQAFGADIRLNPIDEVNLSGILAKTWTDGIHDSDFAGRLKGGIATEHTNVGLNFGYIGENFNPEVGFQPRKDVRAGDGWIHQSIPIRKSVFRSITLDGYYSIGYHNDGRFRDRNVGTSLSLDLETGDSLHAWSDGVWEYVDAEWEIQEGIVVPVGTHKWRRYGVHLSTAEHRWLSVRGSVDTGDFFDGHRRSMNLAGHIRPFPKLVISGSYNRNMVDFSDGSFTTNTINSRTIYNFSPKLFGKLFLQWNDDSEIVSGNFLMRYTYRPGSDMYIIYNELWHEGDVEQRSIVAKMTYFLNL